MSFKRPAAPPPHLPGFTYVSLLGSGGFSDVYLYEQDRPRRKVAVKVLLSDLKTEGARRRFESEANLMAQLSSHPYIVTIFEAEVTEAGHSYLAMEYCSRPSLDVRYRRQRFSVDEVLAVGIQVASAVETAHRAGIAHRDIKPANILVTDYNRPALTDFGISGTLGSDADEDAGMSIPWSPPEQFTGGAIDGVLVDVWALGATLYTLLAGRSPFVMPGADNSQRELISRITTMALPRLGRPDVPESLELALSTAMAKSAVSRYSSAHAFALALQRTQAELNLSVTPFEVLEEPRHEENHPDDGFEETRVRNIAAIDPERTGSAPTFPARTRPQLPGHVFTGQPFTEEQPGAHRSGGNTSGEWAQATMLRGSAPAAEYGLVRDAPIHDAPVHDASAQDARAQDAVIQDALIQDATVQRPALPPDALRQVGRQEAPASLTGRAEPELDATVSRPARAEAAEAATPETAADHGRRNLWLAISGGTLLVLAIIVGIVLGTSAPPPKAVATDQVSKAPADALDNGTVPDVAGLAGKIDGNGKATFTWTNPQPKSGDAYKWRVYTVGGSGEYQSTPSPTAQVAVNPTEPTCIQVMIIRSDGSSSPLEKDSIGCIRN
ncbi:serine/threonine protein kinase [Arthrobacter sp. ISL-48]|uniref:serine/threonine-protein kinase n=1 Tax=Arthrobacter sp. ISL-48 TaxID=2819110 RepID=UPI001BEC9DE7|nr:serine/threonine-protein kinase [Arthrobacter sp. ISL-48]MBT2530717.1 serine/threonine protein kinase [Arthrobacter sp. ISL-48]